MTPRQQPGDGSTNTSWLVAPTHNALSITPPAGFNRDRAATTAASVNTSTISTQSARSTEPGSGTVSDQP